MVVFIFLGCSVLGDDIESRNITYDLICPVSRPALFAGRYLSYLASALVLVMPALVAAFTVCMARFGADAMAHSMHLLWAVLIATATGALVYGAAFLFLSLIVKRAIFATIIAIVLSVCIEGFVANIPLRVSSCSVLYHLQNIMYGISGEIGFFPVSVENDLLRMKGVYEVTTFDSVLTLALLWVGFMIGSLLMFRRKEFA
jgi:ABC-type transport system involved in multi-copper enzyme maturation permease subunit